MLTNRLAGQRNRAAQRVSGAAAEDLCPRRLLDDELDRRKRQHWVDAGPVRVRTTSLRPCDRCGCGQGGGDTDGQITVLDIRAWDDDRSGRRPYQYLVLAGRGVLALVLALVDRGSGQRLEDLDVGVAEAGECGGTFDGQTRT